MPIDGLVTPSSATVQMRVCPQAKRLQALDSKIVASPLAVLDRPCKAPNILLALTRPQNSNLTAIWPLRGWLPLAVLVTLPKLVSPKSESGVRKRV